MSTLKEQPQPGRRAKNKADKLRRIEDAARALFDELGYEATTTRAIAERADVAAGTLFTYFPEKRQLLLHLLRDPVDRAVERAFRTMPAVPPADPVDALVHLFGAVYRVYARDPRLSRVFVKELLFVDGDVNVEAATWTMSFVARLGALMETWRRAGALGANTEPATAAYQVFSLYYFGLVGWLGSAPVTPAVRDGVFRASLVQLMQGIGGKR